MHSPVACSCGIVSATPQPPQIVMVAALARLFIVFGLPGWRYEYRRSASHLPMPREAHHHTALLTRPDADMRAV